MSKNLYRIEVISGPSSGTSFEVAEGQTFVIGRGKDSHTHIPDPQMSRVHCRIDWFDGTPWIVDADSVAGTLVKKNRISRQQLSDGSEFEAGGSLFRFHIESPKDLEAAESSSSTGNPLLSGHRHTSSPLEELVGQTLGNYCLDAVIAVGSTGVIFKAHDINNRKEVAVKVLTPDNERRDEQKERFVRAMKTMLEIRHPHIVQLYGAGKTGPYCWAAMQYVKGDSLTQVIDWIGIGNALRWQEVFSVAVQIGRALQEAERHQIIHRNVTPRNILRRSMDSCHLLGDLMLAKALEGTLAHAITKPGQIVGELRYLPPERTVSNAGIDCRSDLYGLGAALYGLITGRAPCHGKTTIEIIQSIRAVVPPKPSVFQKDIHPEFESVIMHLLEKNPDDRIQSAKSLLLKLERIASDANLVTDWANWVD